MKPSPLSSRLVIASVRAAFLAAFAAPGVQAAGVPGQLEEVVVTARRLTNLEGEVLSASVGTVLGEQLETRPVLRTGEVLEVVPGLVVTQHSGGGKANQYFLRGFNLDHGTDFATRVEGIPVNMPTHAHGQGYSDINFMIPELVDRIEYRKGTYYAEEGNFSAAGSVDVTYRKSLPEGMAVFSGGQYDYGRGLLAVSPRLGSGTLLLAADATYSDGPWELAEHLRKFNAVAKYSQGDAQQGWQLLGMGYRGRWRSTDQIPQRAVQDDALGRFGFIDPSDGGSTHRYSLSASGWQPLGTGTLRATGYAMNYGLDLFSNFTYSTDTVNGDQFEQYDDRRVYGADVAYSLPTELADRKGHLRAGLQWRRDDIGTVGLYKTLKRERLQTTREDTVVQSSYSAWLSQEQSWAPWLRTEVGLRADAFDFRVGSNIAANSGQADDHIISPKVSMVLGPWARSEIFVNWGRGFHSNDARGTTIRVDPLDGTTPVDRVSPLVRATGYEVGVRSALSPGLQLASSLWTLKVDSELLFIGDGGITEASRASRRTGLEFSAYYAPSDVLIIDADLAFTRPRFVDDDPVGRRIPNAVDSVASVGFSWHDPSGWFGGTRLRYLGPAALIEDNSVRSKSTLLANFDLGYRFSRNLSGSVTLLNAFGEKANDITYFYESRLPGESAPVADVHFHPVEPRQLRGTFTLRF